ncbi:MAG: ABC transporter ATP-binding protein [Deltaproteobacteria bacterium]|jgi:ABC-type nitrate/sulfonate/bicarbonate transport system ATPase subunit|nr:ABC transporter ATP-binding protein [Deltaproteobacteria bacterium]
MNQSSVRPQSLNKVEICGLYKVYEETSSEAALDSISDRHVLTDLNFAVPARSFTCFLGPSGCGKSTLLRIIAGFDTPSRGEVLVDGDPVCGPNPKHIFVFQEDGLFPWFTAYENIELGIRNLKDSQKRHELVLEYLEMVGLKGFGGYYPHELSGGMRRRAEVARALIANPDILFMDEPFGALDFVTRLQMREEMLNVHAMFPTTILFITHDIDEAIQLADQIVLFTERPTSVKEVLSLGYPHPRDFTKGDLAVLRRHIYRTMGVHAAL